ETQFIRVSEMTPEAFAEFGIDEFAYVKRVRVQGDWAFGIFGADGKALGVAPNQDTALAAIREHAMQAQTLH
ncbi:MAG: DUF1150 family protein, partial [Alphaproteobacteria bacterium]|nr:DUF1150 family protein [Alphaproteobacteria bacterium]